MKVRVNAIAPGAVKTPLSLGMLQEGLEFSWTADHLIKEEITVDNVSG